MLKYFNEKFNVTGPLKRLELEEAVIKKYGELHFFYSKGWTETSDYMERIMHSPAYACKISSAIETVTCYDSIENAFIGLFMENSRRLKGLVKKVYEGEK